MNVPIMESAILHRLVMGRGRPEVPVDADDESIWDDKELDLHIHSTVDGYWSHRILQKVIDDRLQKGLEFVLAWEVAEKMLGKAWATRMKLRCEYYVEEFLRERGLPGGSRIRQEL